MPEFLNIPLDQIAVVKRYRTDVGDIRSLVDDMLTIDMVDGKPQQRGQLQPGIVRAATEEDRELYGIDPKETPWILVAGGRRYMAVTLAGITTYAAIIKGTLSPMHQRIYELHENLLREQLSWADEVLLKDEIHRLRKSENPAWTQTDTGEEIGETTANVSRDLALAEEIRKNPQLAHEPTKLAAVSKVKAERVAADREARIKSIPKGKLAQRLLADDMVMFAEKMPDDSVDLMFMDFPFGRLPYETDPTSMPTDDSDKLRPVLADILPHLIRITKETGWLALMAGNHNYSILQAALAEYRVEDPTWIWVMTNSIQVPRQPDAHTGNQYERICVVNMGKGTLTTRGKSNVISAPIDEPYERTHPMQLPHAVCLEIVQRLTVGGERVADFCFGSGAMLAAAVELERDIIGCDIDPEALDPALTWVSEHMPQ